MSDDHTYDIDPEIEALLAELSPDDVVPTAPPATVWAGIERELADDPSAAPAPTAPLAPVVQLRRRRVMTAVLAAAAVVVVAVGAVVVLSGGGDTNVVAATQLSYDPSAFDPLGAGATATAKLVEHDGTYEIELDDTVLPEVDTADLELWLIEADDTGNLVDVAPVSLIEGAGTYAVPAGLDVTTHRIVDISIEPRDGDDAHSGRSILRGALPEV